MRAGPRPPPSGAGKTTFLRVCLGQQPVDKGEVKIGETVKFGHYTQLAEFPDPSMARGVPENWHNRVRCYRVCQPVSPT